MGIDNTYCYIEKFKEIKESLWTKLSRDESIISTWLYKTKQEYGFKHYMMK